MSIEKQKSDAKKHDLHLIVDERTFLDAKEAGINISRACERMLKDLTAKMIVPTQTIKAIGDDIVVEHN